MHPDDVMMYRRDLLADHDFLAGDVPEHPLVGPSGARRLLTAVENDQPKLGPYFEEYAIDDLRQVDAAVRAVSRGQDYDREAAVEALDTLYDALDVRESAESLY